MRKVLLALLACWLFAAGGAQAQEPVPDFHLDTLGGSSVRLSDYLGKKDIVINFWASWCEACKEEMPALLKLKDQGGSGVVFLGINVGDSERAVQRFADKLGFSYQILMDRDKAVARRYKVVGVPHTVVISRQGEIVYSGSSPPANLAVLLQARR